MLGLWRTNAKHALPRRELRCNVPTIEGIGGITRLSKRGLKPLIWTTIGRAGMATRCGPRQAGEAPPRPRSLVIYRLELLPQQPYKLGSQDLVLLGRIRFAWTRIGPAGAARRGFPRSATPAPPRPRNFEIYGIFVFVVFDASLRISRARRGARLAHPNRSSVSQARRK